LTSNSAHQENVLFSHLAVDGFIACAICKLKIFIFLRNNTA
jgi:hypothetical protein